jgi:hypothetical protein
VSFSPSRFTRSAKRCESDSDRVFVFLVAVLLLLLDGLQLSSVENETCFAVAVFFVGFAAVVFVCGTVAVGAVLLFLTSPLDAGSAATAVGKRSLCFLNDALCTIRDTLRDFAASFVDESLVLAGLDGGCGFAGARCTASFHDSGGGRFFSVDTGGLVLTFVKRIGFEILVEGETAVEEDGGGAELVLVPLLLLRMAMVEFAFTSRRDQRRVWAEGDETTNTEEVSQGLFCACPRANGST